jgi:DASH complex subunit ASK1
MQFWTSFYEQAAQIRIPTSDDHSTVNEFPSEQEASEMATENTMQDATGGEEVTFRESGIDHRDASSHSTPESSFHPNQDAFSSTPATAHKTPIQDITTGSIETPSWSASLESPFVKLSNEVKNFSLTDEGTSVTPSSVANTTDHLDEPTPMAKPQSLSNQTSLKGKQTPPRETLLRHQFGSGKDLPSVRASSKKTSPLKPSSKPKSPIKPKSYNPYIPAGTKSSKWSGVVDLRDPTANTPRHPHRSYSSRSHNTAGTSNPHSDDDDDDFDDLPPGMSPPVMMSPVRFRVTDHKLLAPTPSKHASARIKQDILRSVQRPHHYGTIDNVTESSLSTLPTPPSFSQYQNRNPLDITSSSLDPSFDSMMRRVGLEVPHSSSQPLTIGGIVDDGAAPADDSLDSDDSLDDFNSVTHPSAAFLMAAEGVRISDDDSFESNQSSSDSLNDEEAHLEGAVPLHPFAGGIEDTGDDDSDSFDDEYPPRDGAQTETLFGVPPGQGIAGVQGAQPLRMLGQDMLEDFTATGAYVAGVEESPTPAGWNGNR